VKNLKLEEKTERKMMSFSSWLNTENFVLFCSCHDLRNLTFMISSKNCWKTNLYDWVKWVLCRERVVEMVVNGKNEEFLCGCWNRGRRIKKKKAY